MRIIVALLLIAVAGVCASAQSLNLFNIDTSGYPTIRADYTAIDGTGKMYTGLTSADFRVVERMSNNALIDLTASLRQGCDQTTVDSAASLLIIIDLSGSMTTLVKGVSRLNIAKTALRDLISQLTFSSGTEVCIIGFSTNVRMVCPWSGSPTAIIDSINKMTPNGGTNYENPFTGNPNMFDEFRKRPPGTPKMAIFITDGRPSPPIANPTAFVDSISIHCFDQSIVLHSVTVDHTTTYPPLADLCARTGGTSYVGSDAVLENMIRAASSAATSRKVCFLEWQSPVGCGLPDRIRTAIVTLVKDTNPVDTVAYTSALLSTNLVETSIPLLDFGNLAAGESREMTISFTPTTYDWNVIGFTMIPTTNFEVLHWDYPNGNPNPPSSTNVLTFLRRMPRTLLVRFKQDNVASDHTASLQLLGDKCSTTQPLRAGAVSTLLRLDSPNLGGAYTTCGDTVDIRWSGVSAQTAVRIQWTLDGVTWSDIAAAATGNLYRWVPTQTGANVKVRVMYNPLGHYRWLHHLGHTGSDTVTSVAAAVNSGNTFVTGWYKGSTQFGNGIVYDALGAIDGYCHELDTNGKTVRTHLLTGEKFKNERVIGAVTDKAGNVYIAGTFESVTAKLSNDVDTVDLKMPSSSYGVSSDVSNMFVSKIDPLGNILWVRYGQGLPGKGADVRATSIGIRVDANGQPEIVVGGIFKGYMYAGIAKSGKYLEFGPGLPTSPFHVIYNQAGGPIDLFRSAAPVGYQYATKQAVHADGSVYDADVFTGDLKKEVFTAKAHGTATDVFVVSRKAGKTVSDESDVSFAIGTPRLTLTPDTLSLPQTIVRQTSKMTFTRRLCNPENYPTTITSTVIDGANASEFKLAKQLRGITLQPGECVDIEVRFTPTSAGKREAMLHVKGNCADLVLGMLVGDAAYACDIFVLDTLRMDNIKMGTAPTVRQCVLRNETNVALKVTAHIEPPGTLFDLSPKTEVTLAPNECLMATVTFNATAAVPSTHTAQIVFDLPSNCGVVSTELVANVVDSATVVRDTIVTIESIDWFTRRVGTVNDSTIYLFNKGDDPVIVETIVAGINASDIRIDNNTLPTLPVLLQVGDSIAVGIRYAPTLRGPQVTDVLATIRGLNVAVKGLAKGHGVLPAITGLGDNWPSTPVFVVSPRIGSVVIRNTDALAPLYIGALSFVNPSQSDFLLLTPQTISFPYMVPPGGTLNIPVEFTPQDVGVRRELVQIMHDAIPGSHPVPVFADTLVELVGIGEALPPSAPVAFSQTLTCEASIASFWLKNPSSTTSMDVLEVTESDADNVFEIVGSQFVTIPPADSAQMSVRFSPTMPQLYSAVLDFRNSLGMNQYFTCTGQGTTTPLRASIVALPPVILGAMVQIPVLLQPAQPMFTDSVTLRVELLYPKQSLAFVDVRVEPVTSSILNVDNSVPGRLAVDLSSYVTQDIMMMASFGSLLASDTLINIAANVSTEYDCIITNSTDANLAFIRPCAGSGRVVSMGAKAFALEQPYPTPATDNLTIRYATGYVSATTFEIVDAIGNIVRMLTIGEQPSAEYEVDVPVLELPNGAYALRMTSGHYVQSRMFNVVR